MITEERTYNPPPNVADSISRIVGDVAYLRNQQFQDCRLGTGEAWKRPFRFTRWYFRAEPKTLVDKMSQPEAAKRADEIAFKREWVANLGWKYALVINHDYSELQPTLNGPDTTDFEPPAAKRKYTRRAAA